MTASSLPELCGGAKFTIEFVDAAIFGIMARWNVPCGAVGTDLHQPQSFGRKAAGPSSMKDKLGGLGPSGKAVVHEAALFGFCVTLWCSSVFWAVGRWTVHDVDCIIFYLQTLAQFVIIRFNYDLQVDRIHFTDLR